MRLNWFYKGDLDGFFGLFVDNLLQLMLITVLCQTAVGLPVELVHGRILPGAAFSILLGNLYYAWQAKRLAESTGRPHTTALPYGINTVSLFAYVFLVMAPVYRQTGSPELAWKAGLFACLGSAAIESAGAFLGEWLRRHTPRAAMLSCLAGIALTFISMGFVFQIFANPLLAVPPALFILFAYASQIRLPLGLPAGLASMLLGTALAWGLRSLGLFSFQTHTAPYTPTLYLPASSWGELWDFLAHHNGWKYLSVIFPMGLFNVLGSLQNLESAEAAGDRFPTRSSLLINGLGSLSACLLGSPFPTTIYIGHPGWKAMGARWGYSALNGIVVAVLCLTGGVTWVLKVVPLEAMIGILLWIGLIIGAQAYKEVPRHHFLGVAFGFIPTLAAWLLLQLETSLRVAGSSLFLSAPKFGSDLYIHGVISLSQGFLVSSMIFAALLVHVSERRFKAAAAWALAASVLSFVGVIHAYDLNETGVQNRFGVAAAPGFAMAYLACAALLGLLHISGPFDRPESSWDQAYAAGERRRYPRSGRPWRRFRRRRSFQEPPSGQGSAEQPPA